MINGGHSLKCQQWLSVRQTQDPFLLNNDGTRATIHTKFHRGEKSFPRSKRGAKGEKDWFVDGVAFSDNGTKLYEFLGCYFHRGCPQCDPEGVDEIFDKKKADLMRIEGNVQLEVITECQFDNGFLPDFRDYPNPAIPHILQDKHSLDDILQSIKDDKLFGYVVVDIETPEHLTFFDVLP